MTTLIKLLKTKFSHRQPATLDDFVLCDIGVSRVVVEYRAS
jgi:hypothetical protein